MKKALLLITFIALCLLTACQKDFDELNDTRQRWVAFTFDPSDYFFEVLVATEPGYELGASTELEDGYGLRIVGYCYDSDSLLVAKNTVFGDLKHELAMKFKHLDGETCYHFLFIADIVKYDSEVDYYETWYQLLTNSLSSFYLISFDRSEIAAYNMLRDAKLDVTPANQTIEVQMSPSTYNGYCIFENIESTAVLNLSSKQYGSFYIHNMAGKTQLDFGFSYQNEGAHFYVIPITATLADNSIDILISKNNNGLNVTKHIIIQDTTHQPFLAKIDYESLQLTELNLY